MEVLRAAPEAPMATVIHALEPGAGHYGIFAGKSWRNNIRPLVLDFIDSNARQVEPANVNVA